ncbi:mannosyl-oligosaccharide alpha-1,2-mannosidase [Serendipita sp. 401]|nr:mannosyl-oligosaccharide alpha-1,2-mannosidase [Serendipita sp. 401]
MDTTRRRTNIEKPNAAGRSSEQASGTPSTTAAVPAGEHQHQPKPISKSLLILIALIIGIAFLSFRTRRSGHEHNIVSPFHGVNRDTLDFTADSKKQDAIVAAFKHAWNAYRRDAWGYDDYHPIKRKGENLSSSGGIGYTIVDALDTLHIMGLHDEFAEAREWVANELSFDRDDKYNAFEVTIRVLGGLLSAYHLSQDEIFLEKATDLGERLLAIFNTNSGIPLSFVNLAKREGLPDSDNNGLSSTAEAATLQLEFKYLAHLTDDLTYWKAAEKVMDVIRNAGGMTGLVPIFMRPEQGVFMTSEIRFGSRGDSYYEYLLKQYLQTNRAEPIYREMYENAMGLMQRDLVKRTPANGVLYVAELHPQYNRETKSMDWKLYPKQDHLVCFLGGSLLLGVTEGKGPFPPEWETLTASQQRDWMTGEDIIKTCVATYNTATGLSPEIVHFKTSEDKDADSVDWYIKGSDPSNPDVLSFDARYILRPETVESLFLAWRQTGDQKYRDQGWKIFEAIEKYTKVEDGGYTSILNVNSTHTPREDKMETFFLVCRPAKCASLQYANPTQSETLKYLYLLFSDSSVLPLDQYVFNTEAHPLPVFQP